MTDKTPKPVPNNMKKASDPNSQSGTSKPDETEAPSNAGASSSSSSTPPWTINFLDQLSRNLQASHDASSSSIVDLTNGNNSSRRRREPDHDSSSDTDVPTPKKKKGKKSKQGKKSKKKKPSKREVESSSDSDSSSDSSDASSSSSDDVKTILKKLVNGKEFANADPTEVMKTNELKFIRKVAKKYPSKDFQKFLAKVQEIAKECAHDPKEYHAEFLKIAKKYKKVKKQAALFKLPPVKKSSAKEPVQDKKEVMHGQKKCPHCTHGGDPSTCWTLQPHLRPRRANAPAPAPILAGPPAALGG
jgi:hypothetical protein